MRLMPNIPKSGTDMFTALTAFSAAALSPLQRDPPSTEYIYIYTYHHLVLTCIQLYVCIHEFIASAVLCISLLEKRRHREATKERYCQYKARRVSKLIRASTTSEEADVIHYDKNVMNVHTYTYICTPTNKCNMYMVTGAPEGCFSRCLELQRQTECDF